jgi:hypothetical protein
VSAFEQMLIPASRHPTGERFHEIGGSQFRPAAAADQAEHWNHARCVLTARAESQEDVLRKIEHRAWSPAGLCKKGAWARMKARRPLQ